MGSNTRQQKRPKKKLKNSSSSTKQSESKPPSISPAWAFGLSELDALITLGHILERKYSVEPIKFSEFFRVLHQNATVSDKEYALYFIAILITDNSSLFPGSLLWDFYTGRLSSFLSKFTGKEHQESVSIITEQCKLMGVTLKINNTQ
jgi:hypothetical protein